ncbi:MAG: hypothetical protein ABSD20_05750 [Terriglobales bacterium]|jgi:trimeric autotransporter adhesin
MLILGRVRALRFFSILALAAPAAVALMLAGCSPAPGTINSISATKSILNNPRKVATDSKGNIYIADSGNNVVRKVNSGGYLSTVAGTGGPGFSGDGGQATSATLNSPQGVAVDSSGNIYIADAQNCRIRKVDTGGLISTVAGNGIRGFNGDGTATNVEFNQPQGISLDSSGDLLITDSGNNLVRKLTGGMIVTLLITPPTPSDTLQTPTDVVQDSSGNLLIAAELNNQVWQVPPSGGQATVAAGSGVAGYFGDGDSATVAELTAPAGLALDSSGNLYIADSGNSRIRIVSSGTITTIAGNGTPGYGGDGGPATSAELDGPQGVVVRSNTLYIADTSNALIRYVSGI